jgi:NADPH-dependent curcumin reductase CurA
MPLQSREIRLRSRPEGLPSADNFSLETVTLPDPGPGEIQVRNQWMSVDPYMRGRMRDVPSYVPPFEIGKPLEGGAVGTVVQSNHKAFAPGDVVSSFFGWREAFNVPGDLPAQALHRIDTTHLAPEYYLGIAGVPGLTAYVAMLEIAKVGEGDIVFISSAAGAVGLVAAQIAKLKGATVIGSAGGQKKCDYLLTIGVDQVIDYKAVPDLTAALRQAAPKGIDVYLDSVGGPHLEAALVAARPFARFAMCGMIASYNGASPAVRNLEMIVGKRLRLQGFIVSDHLALMPKFYADLAGWVATGQVTATQTVDHGIENAPAAFLKLFSGENLGKMLVKLS